MNASNWIHLDVERIVRETNGAFLLQLDEDNEVWVPKSQVADAADYSEGDENLILSVTSWWADKEGLA
jgi:hypothetical protein